VSKAKNQSSDDKSLSHEIVQRIVREIRPWKIILFGSRSKGTARSDSDFDILVIAESKEPRFRRAAPLYGALSDVIWPMDILVYTPQEVEDWRNVPQAFDTTAVREGKLLYENPGGPGQKLAA